jgi:hypothetical protein
MPKTTDKEEQDILFGIVLLWLFCLGLGLYSATRGHFCVTAPGGGRSCYWGGKP